MSLFKGVSTTTKAEKIASFQSTSCDFGTPLPIAYGTCKLAPNLINHQDMETKEKKTTTKTGKSKSTQIDYLYYVYMELALCEGPIDSIGKIWVGDTCYDGLASLNADSNEGAPLSVNLGNNSNPTTYMQTNHSNIACGYSNMAYLYGKVFLGTNTASCPSYNVQVNGLLRSTGDGTDANPADIIIDLLTRVGLGDYVDDAPANDKYNTNYSFGNYRKYCHEAGLLMSTPPNAFSSQTKVQDVIKTILSLTNAYMFWSVDRYKIVPRDDQARGDWTPNRTICYDLTTDDLIKQSGGACITFSRKDTSEICNRFGVTFVNRDNDYEEETVFFENPTSITADGLNAASTVDGKWFYTKERAIKCAEMQARINNTELIEYTFKLDWAFERLEPGDLVTLTDDAIGLDHQPVMVKSISFDKYGRPTVKAVYREPGNYSAAAYDVHEVDYNYVNLNVEPGNTAAPLFIIPPSDLVTSANGLEIWIALHGANTNWGGCNVYLSDKDGDYTFNGTQPVSSSYGTITTAMTANSTSVTVHFSNPKTVELLTGSALDANNGNTLFWVDGECMSYTLATLTGANSYTLSGLIRGQFGTTAAAHNSGDSMAILDGNIYVVPLTKHYTGRTMYFKFPAFNAFQGRGQDLVDVDYYTCVANTCELPNVSSTSLIAYTKYRELADDVTRYDIVVQWTAPDFESYNGAQVWYKTSNGGADNMAITNGMKATEVGYQSSWQYAGIGLNTVTIPQAVIGDTYKIAVCTTDIYGNKEAPDASTQTQLTVAMKSETPNTPANAGTSLSQSSFNIYWDEVRNADIKYYELRLDTNVGVENSNFIGRTTDKYFATTAITQRIGKIYLYAISAYNKASAPAVIEYQYGKPVAPVLTLDAKIQGIQCKAGGLPVNCHAIHWYFEAGSNIADVVNQNVTYYHSCQPSVYSVYACYVDYFGDGNMSASYMVTVKQYIDPALIQEASLGADKLNASTQQALAQAVSSIQPADLSTWWNGEKGNYYTSSQTDTKIHEGLVTYVDENVYAYVEEKTSEAVEEVMQTISPEGVLRDYATQNWTSSQINSSVATINDTTDGLRTDLTSVQQTATSINNIATRLSELASTETFKEVKKSIHNTLTVGQVVTWTANNTSLEFYVDVKPGEVYSVSLYGGNSSSWKVWFTDNSNKVLCRGCVGLTSTATTGTNGDNDKLVTSSSTTNFTKIADTVTVPKNTAITRMWLFTRCTSDQATADVAKWASVQKTVYSAITQLADGISLSVTGVSGRSSIDLTQGTLTLNTDLLQVGRAGAMTSIANGAIKTAMLEADCVTADKIDVTDLSAITGTFGTFETLSNDKLGKVIISGGLISVYSRTSTSSTNWVLRVRLGIW